MVITGKYWSVVVMLCGAGVAVAAVQQAATEAPAGFGLTNRAPSYFFGLGYSVRVDSLF